MCRILEQRPHLRGHADRPDAVNESSIKRQLERLDNANEVTASVLIISPTTTGRRSRFNR